MSKLNADKDVGRRQPSGTCESNANCGKRLSVLRNHENSTTIFPAIHFEEDSLRSISQNIREILYIHVSSFPIHDIQEIE